MPIARFAGLQSTESSTLHPFHRALRLSPRIAAAVLIAGLASTALAQPAGRSADSDEFRALPNHVPLWANDANFVAPLDPEQAMSPMTMVLARHADREAAFEKLLADQQDPSSPQFHKWLTPTEIGERFGLSTDQLNALKAWIESQGMHVDWIAPARNFIGFSGKAGDVSRAFQAELNTYDVEGEHRISVATPPMLPGELAPLVSAIRGLYTIEERPLHQVRALYSDSPEVTGSNNGTPVYFIGPDDFTKIYDNANSYTGKGVSIGIVGRSRTDFADFDQFRQKTGTTFANPTEIVPTAFGGIDPGPAYTAPTTADTGAQGEATLDVTRSASIAQQAKVLLVVTTTQGGDIGADAQYLIQTQPVPVQVISISFGLCETHAGPSGVNFWDGLFKQAAGEGISVFVSSGDSGASGCDPSFTSPPVPPLANSPNYICSSSYATCVGGTEFADASDESKYWSSSNGPGFESALSYIPEGAWNEPQSGTDFVPASSGGGVSNYIATPSWQTGTGVPSARAGRYTPDIAFSAAAHDGYFACMAAAGGNCVDNAQNQFGFVYFSGTSAAAPDMAGITALLAQKEGKGQGNLNPELYAQAKSSPSAFHDVTVATSAVSGCKVTTPSMCNNSVPSPTALTGGQAGFLVTAGYDEVTGLGSLDVNKFLATYINSSTKAPIATTGADSALTATGVTLAGTVNPNGAATQYWFLYGTSSTLVGGIKSAAQSASGSTAIAITAKLTGLTPGTKYYFELQASNATGPANGAISSFTTPKASQTITFKQPASPVKYGVKPIALSATSSAALAVKLTLVSGPGKLSGSTLTVTGAGTIVIAANQAGNTSYLAAAKVTRSIVVDKAPLTVSAKNLTMNQGAPVPALAFIMTGWVNADNRGSATKGKPALSTTATSNSVAGNYPIKISAGTMVAPNYAPRFVNGTMTVKP
jgi:subtilase family serine protease